jgi:hypothetical protein
MAQHRPRPRRQHSRHQPTLLRPNAVPYRVDAKVQQMQSAGAQSLLDPSPANPEPGQLSASHDTVLPLCQFGDRSVGATNSNVASDIYLTFDAVFDLHPSILASKSARVA